MFCCLWGVFLNCSVARIFREAESLVLKANGYGGLRTVGLRPFSVYGEGDKLVVDPVQKTGLVYPSPHYHNLSYVGNLVRWHLLAEEGLEKKPEVVGGQAYFVADEEKQLLTRDAFNDFLIEALRVKPAPLNTTILKFLCYILPTVDWYMCGTSNAQVFQVNPIAYVFMVSEARYDVSKGIKDLGYTTRYDMGSIRENFRRYYKLN